MILVTLNPVDACAVLALPYPRFASKYLLASFPLMHSPLCPHWWMNATEMVRFEKLVGRPDPHRMVVAWWEYPESGTRVSCLHYEFVGTFLVRVHVTWAQYHKHRSNALQIHQ